MDYVVGGVAALISGNVTPSRPKTVKRALTPVKHQPSPNITPKSEMVADRSIFLSPSVQKKKAIMKKSPKRIFQNADLDVTNDGEATVSPKANKVKKHLKNDLENGNSVKGTEKVKSPENKRNKSANVLVSEIETKTGDIEKNTTKNKENTGKKKQRNPISGFQSEEEENVTTVVEVNINTSVKKNKKKGKLNTANAEQNNESKDVVKDETVNNQSPKKKRKNKSKGAKNISANAKNVEDNNETDDIEMNTQVIETNNSQGMKKKNKKRRKSKMRNQVSAEQQDNTEAEQNDTEESKEPPKKKKKQDNACVNPNAVTDKDSDSEHESDDEIEESENEQSNKKILDTEPAEESSDDEEKQKEPENKEVKLNTEEEVKRTLFVGNVPFSKKCKKEIKKIFSKYGQIDSVRIRTVPVKDATVTPKLAVIKSELHPDRSTVNVYVKFNDPASVEKALVENNTVLHEHHLRVSRSERTGVEHDPSRSIFVGNIPFTLEDETLRATFEKCGEIESVRIIRDRKTNAGKGFGYVNFTSKDGVELALNLTDEDLTIKNRILRVKRCTQQAQRQKQRPPGKGGKFQGKFNGNSQGNKLAKTQDGQNQKKDGAYRRIKNAKQKLDGEGPPNKKQEGFNQPNKEKKSRKEFVGMTADKKKKPKFNKGQKKKKVLSEILTK